VPPKFSPGTRVTQSYQLYLVRGNLHREGEGLRVVESHAHLGAPVGHLSRRRRWTRSRSAFPVIYSFVFRFYQIDICFFRSM